MVAPTDKPAPFDPFGVVAGMDGWCCLLKAARELRDIDAEMMKTKMEAEAPGPGSLNPEVADIVSSVEALMRSLGLDPVAIRRNEPGAMRELEAACLGCRERSRCTRELRAGTAARTYPEFCPNAARLDRVRHA